MNRTRTGATVATLALLLSLFVELVPSQAARPDGYILPGAQVFPEGIAYQPGSDYFYVSSTTDGAIYRGSLKEEVSQVFLPGGQDGRTTARGLKADRQGRLFVAGGPLARAYIYDTQTKALLASYASTRPRAFFNDVILDKDGNAYFTDSNAPVLYRASPNSAGQYTFEEWLDFSNTAFTYAAGFNANGIDVTPDGKYLIIVQSNLGKLWRIETATKQVAEIDLGGAKVTNGDGILFTGRGLYVSRNADNLIALIILSGDLSSGFVSYDITDPAFVFPTTLAEARGRLLVVNSQLSRRTLGLPPQLPFSILVETPELTRAGGDNNDD